MLLKYGLFNLFGFIHMNSKGWERKGVKGGISFIERKVKQKRNGVKWVASELSWDFESRTQEIIRFSGEVKKRKWRFERKGEDCYVESSLAGIKRKKSEGSGDSS